MHERTCSASVISTASFVLKTTLCVPEKDSARSAPNCPSAPKMRTVGFMANLKNGGCRHRNNILCFVPDGGAASFHYSICEIPCQNKNEVGLIRNETFEACHRYMHTRSIKPLLIGAVIHNIVENIRTDVHIVQKRIALCRSAIARNPLSLGLQIF